MLYSTALHGTALYRSRTCVVYDASLLVGKNAEGACAVCQPCNVTHNQPFQELNRILALQGG